MPTFEANLRQQIIQVARLVAEQGFSSSNEGNLSARLDADRLLITPAGLYKRLMKPSDLVVIDMQGQVLQARNGLSPTSEYRLHLEVYRRRPDAGAIIHAHAPYVTALTLVGQAYPVEYLPEVLAVLGDAPTAPYATPGTPALAQSIAGLIEHHDAVLLSHHGSLNTGATPMDALIGLERLEQAARIYWLARALGQPQPLPPEELALLRAFRAA